MSTSKIDAHVAPIKAGDTLSFTSGGNFAAPWIMGFGYCGSSSKALNFILNTSRPVTASSFSATTIRMTVFSPTGQIFASNAANDLITGSVYTASAFIINPDTGTLGIKVEKTDGTAFDVTNQTPVMCIISVATFNFS